ncbi:MAG TPA: DNA-directed RNA polymerase subunit D [Candidatus Binatia bacterium]|nr:DNA-directed RNA polymerase subunit D [Candidatus Binatia bacterium]
MTLTHVETDKKSGRETFLMKDVTPAFANALRRTIIEMVPTMAIDDVEIVKNGSALYDEMVAHRLGLIPLKTDLKGYTPKDQCDCKGAGCAKCTVQLTLKAKGPAIVLAEELKSKDPKIKPVFPDMPIVELLKGQELELECTAILGRGNEHVKWSPGLAWYSYEPIITVNNNSSKLAECKDKLPPQVFDKSGKIDAKLITSHLVDAVDGVCPDVVKVERNEKNMLFSVEPWGQLSAREIVTTAFSILAERFAEFEKKFGEA